MWKNNYLGSNRLGDYNYKNKIFRMQKLSNIISNTPTNKIIMLLLFGLDYATCISCKNCDQYFHFTLFCIPIPLN